MRHINLLKEHPERIKKTSKKIVKILNYDGIEFQVQEKDFNKIEVKNNIRINVIDYADKLVFPIYVSHQKLKDPMVLLLLNDDDKSHYVYMKDFNRYILTKLKIKTINGFVKVVYSVLIIKVC